METYGKILLIAMPIFLFFVLFEKWYGWKKGYDTVNNMDMISSLSSGITNVTKDVLGLSIGILSYGFMVKHLALFNIQNTILVYFVAFIAIDFQGYWIHRWSHHINIFWNKHLIHHSSEEFNLACALRQSISSIFQLFTFLLLPAAILGVPQIVIATILPIHLFAQFWYHTRHINKMGILEKIIVTPSHHRVHHAINKEYLDKNLGQIFIFWDKLFGTYQEELKNVEPVYGITRPVKTWNPIKINYQHLWLLILDAWRTKSLWDKCRIWFLPTGWRPLDVEEKFPVNKIEDPYRFEKYNPKASTGLQIWIWFQISITLTFASYLFYNIANIGSPQIFIYGAFLFLMVYAYTELMDRSNLALLFEMIKNCFGFYIIYSTNDWFKVSLIIPNIHYFLYSYFILSALITSYFIFKIFKEDNDLNLSI